MWQVGNIIRTSAGSECPVSALIAFPAPAFLLGPPFLGHIRNLALLMLLDGTVWMLELRGEAWSDERLGAAARILDRVSKQAFTKSSIECLLRKELGTRSISLEPPLLDRVDIRQWDIEKVAFALARHPAARRSAAESCERREWAARAEVRDALDEALCCFVDRMDREALRAATRGRRFDLRIYNYLAHREYRRYRLQFAETFPGLLQTAVVAEPRSLGEELRSIVDSGAPLIKGLAARWNVRPGVIRHLVGRASGDIGVQWMRDAKGLALALDALHPQDLPGDSAAEWSEFNRIVATGQRLFYQPIWESPAGLEWLRECVRRIKRENRRALGLWLPAWGELAGIDRLRAALGESLRRETTDAPSHFAAGADEAIEDAIDSAVLAMARRGLSETASLFSEELERARRKDEPTRQLLSGEVLMPLVPEDFVSADRTTRVAALTTDRQLRAHGTRMQNCLRFGFVRDLARQIGTVFIVGLYDAPSGKALSTAEIKLVANRSRGAYRFITKQHTAMANRRPSRRCDNVLREFLLHCQTDAVREHLANSWKKLGRSPVGQSAQPVNLPAVMRCTLGAQHYEELLGRIREANDVGDARAASV
jgi:hypothetical protein